MTTTEPLTMFDIPAEDPLPPPSVLSPVSMSVKVDGLTLSVDGDLDLSMILYGREGEIDTIVKEQGIDRSEAALYVVQEHFRSIIEKFGCDGYLLWEADDGGCFDWSDGLAEEAFEAIVPRYPKRFVGDD